MKTTASIVLAGALLLVCGVSEADGLSALLRDSDIGVLFNTDNLLMDVESYQGGVGLKLSGDVWAYRMWMDLSFSTAPNSASILLGGAVERHLTAGGVSPYVGGRLTVGYAYDKTEYGSADWTRTISVPVTLGGLFGVEVYLLRFVSLFAEYDLSLTASYSSTETVVASEKTSDSGTDWSVRLGAGNQSKIGIVIYFRQGRAFEFERIGRSSSER